MLFNPALVAFDSFSTPVFFTGIFIVVFGFFVAYRVQGSPIGRWYFAFAASVGVYTIGVGISYAVASAGAALLWDRIAHIGVAFMPYTLYGSTVAIIGVNDRERRVRRRLLVVALLQVALVWGTNLILTGIVRVPWGWFSEYGLVGVLFVAYAGAVFLYVLYRYIVQCKQSTQRLHRRRLRWQVIAIIIGLTTVVDLLPALGIAVYPFGYVPLALFAVITGYAVLRYRMVDVTPELAASTILMTLSSVIIVVDQANIIRIANSRAHEILGRPDGSLINRSLETVGGEAETTLFPVSEQAPVRDVERTWNPPTGGTIVVSVSASHLTDARGNVLGTVFVGHDVTRRKRAEQELERHALYDDLTGLPNRKLFFDRFEVMLQATRRDRYRCGILYLDLNGFKEINDRYGHQSGDTVLRTAAQRMLSAVRTSDTVARIGGDEFVVLCAELRSDDDLRMICDKIREAISPPIKLGSDEVAVTTSIGTAVFPDEAEDRDALLAIADKRMYADKTGAPISDR